MFTASGKLKFELRTLLLVLRFAAFGVIALAGADAGVGVIFDAERDGMQSAVGGLRGGRIVADDVLLREVSGDLVKSAGQIALTQGRGLSPTY